MRAAVVAVLLFGCGRIGFDPRGDGGKAPGDGADAPLPPYAPSSDTPLRASNAGASDLFGLAIAVSGDGSTLAIGAYNEASAATGIDGDEEDDTKAQAGAVYVFVRGGGGAWTQQAYIKASNTDLGDAFGTSVAVSADGSTLAVGAVGESSGGNQADNTVMNAGAAYVFVRTGATWAQQAYVKASNTAAGDRFGTAVALADSGDTLVVGAAASGSATGAAYVFERSGGAWTQTTLLTASNADAGDRFGTTIAIAGGGGRIAVAAIDEDSNANGVGGNQADNSVDQSGAVYVFARPGATWVQEAYVKASNSDFGDYFGAALALSRDGSTLAVSAPGEDGGSRGVGGPETEGGAETGAVYVFQRAASWSQEVYIKAPNADANDQFGTALGLSADGTLLFAGAMNEASVATGIDGDQDDNSSPGAGAVYVFERTGAAWAATHYLKATNTDGGDAFGVALGVSASGRTVAIGAYQEDGPGDVAPDSGTIYVIE